MWSAPSVGGIDLRLQRGRSLLLLLLLLLLQARVTEAEAEAGRGVAAMLERALVIRPQTGDKLITLLGNYL